MNEKEEANKTAASTSEEKKMANRNQGKQVYMQPFADTSTRVLLCSVKRETRERIGVDGRISAKSKGKLFFGQEIVFVYFVVDPAVDMRAKISHEETKNNNTHHSGHRVIIFYIEKAVRNTLCGR